MSGERKNQTLHDAIPNVGGFPSNAATFDHTKPLAPDTPGRLPQPTNDPVGSQFLDRTNPFGQHALSRVDELTAISPYATPIPPEGGHNDLMALRAEFPFLPILPFPSTAISMLLVANTAQELVFPEGTTLVMFKSPLNDYYVGVRGNAEVPTLANSLAVGVVHKPEGFLFYVGNIKSMSVISVAGGIVSALCYIVQPKQPSRERVQW